MQLEDEESEKKPLPYELGQDLSDLSVEELEKTVARLETEILRLKAEKSNKSNQLSAAEALFKK